MSGNSEFSLLIVILSMADSRHSEFVLELHLPPYYEAWMIHPAPPEHRRSDANVASLTQTETSAPHLSG